jgi:lysyl-tRNA synthetase class 2
MLEFYQAYSNYTDLMDLTEEMLTSIAERVCGSRVITFDDQQIDFGNWTRLSMKQAIVKFSREKIDEDVLKDRAAVEGLLKNLHAEFDPKMPLGNLMGILFEAVAEEHLIQPTLIYDYPVELSPLSKQKESDRSLVERFELYIGGMEIANGYSELNDPFDQRGRFLAQLEARERGDDEAHQMDDDYIRALSYGMPPTAGEGIGVDRLTMVLTNSTSIRDVILFPHLRPE